MRGRSMLLTGEVSQAPRLQYRAYNSAVTTNCEKSAEAVVAMTMDKAEGTAVPVETVEEKRCEEETPARAGCA